MRTAEHDICWGDFIAFGAPLIVSRTTLSRTDEAIEWAGPLQVIRVVLTVRRSISR
jgi:hypothetical protein